MLQQANDLGGLSSEQLKWGSLGVLWVQNSLFWLLSFYTRKFPSNGTPYLSSTMVVVIEVVKLVICLAAIYVNEGGISGLLTSLRQEIWEDKLTTIKVGVPAFFYTLSNNCLFLSTVYLDASTAQILYQAKLLTTAAFAVSLLGSSLSKSKWASLVALTIGAMAIKANASTKASSRYAANPLVGCLVILVGCTCSSGAGVWFEKMLKGSTTSLWVRNVQLGVFSILIGLMGAFMSDGQQIQQGGFLQGYDSLAWMLVLNQAAGGLLVAFACKYADNILKNFACTLSIVISTLLIWFLYPSDSPMSSLFIGGTLMILVSTYFYGTIDMAEKAEAARRCAEQEANEDEKPILATATRAYIPTGPPVTSHSSMADPTDLEASQS